MATVWWHPRRAPSISPCRPGTTGGVQPLAVGAHITRQADEESPLILVLEVLACLLIGHPSVQAPQVGHRMIEEVRLCCVSR